MPFFGAEIESGRNFAVVVEAGFRLRLTQVCHTMVDIGNSFKVWCKVEGHEPFEIATLDSRNTQRGLLGVVFDTAFDLYHDSTDGSVFIVGDLMPDGDGPKDKVSVTARAIAFAAKKKETGQDFSYEIKPTTVIEVQAGERVVVDVPDDTTVMVLRISLGEAVENMDEIFVYAKVLGEVCLLARLNKENRPTHDVSVYIVSEFELFHSAKTGSVLVCNVDLRRKRDLHLSPCDVYEEEEEETPRAQEDRSSQTDDRLRSVLTDDEARNKKLLPEGSRSGKKRRFED